MKLYLIHSTHKTIQQVEKDWEARLQQERKKCKLKESDNKTLIKQLQEQLHQEREKRLSELGTVQEIKSNLLQQNQQKDIQLKNYAFTIEQQNQQIQQYQIQFVTLQQKLLKKIAKKDLIIQEQDEDHTKLVKDYNIELEQLRKYNTELEYELLSYRQKSVNLQEQPNYEDRVKQLIQDLECQAKKHVQEINTIHQQYRKYINQAQDLGEQLIQSKRRYEELLENQRKLKRENARLKMQFSIKKKYDDSNKENQTNNTKIQKSQEKTRNQHKNEMKDESISEIENQNLSNLVDNIQSNSALINGNIRRMFSLQNIICEGKQFLPKQKMMAQLVKYDNLIRALGALFYTKNRMQDIIPCIFQLWKDQVYENKANRIRNILSESEESLYNKRVNIKDLGIQGKTIQYDSELSQKNKYDEWDEEDFQLNQEEYIKVENSQKSYQIVPANGGNQQKESQYEDEDNISIVDEENGEEEKNVKQEQRIYEYQENDPEVINARLLEKYAQMAGQQQLDQQQVIDSQEQLVYVDEFGQELDRDTLMQIMERQNQEYNQQYDGIDDFIDKGEESNDQFISKRYR